MPEASRSCINCGAAIEAGSAFCGVCGARLDSGAPAGTTCLECGEPVDVADEFCGRCGSVLPVVAAGTIATGQSDQADLPEAPIPGRDRTERRTGRMILLIVGGATVAVAALLGGIWLNSALGSAEVTPTSLPVAVEVTTTPGVTVSAASEETTVPSTSTPPTIVVPTTGNPATNTVPGDLGLAIAMTNPVCDSSYVTLLFSSVEPDVYEEEITKYLADYPGSNYLRTDVTGCRSLRQSLNGNLIYAVYFGPFTSFAEACASRPLDSGAYVKVLNNVSDATVVEQCP